MNANTVTVVFDDEQVTPDDIIRALAEAGYAVPSYDPAS